MTNTPTASKAKTFTAAGLSRELKLDPKVSRRRLRANQAKEKGLKVPSPVKTPGRKNTRYEWPDTKANREMVTAIVAD